MSQRLWMAGYSSLAAATLIARHWPTEGSRQKAALALAGGLLHSDWDKQTTEDFIVAVGSAAGDEELSMRSKAAEYTDRRVQSGKPTVGWPTLAELLGNKVVTRTCGWLGIRSTSIKHAMGGFEYLEDFEYTWMPPIPFDPVNLPPFPAESFSPAIKDYIGGLSKALQVPPDLVGCLVLGIGAAAGAGRCVVRLNEGWSEPLNIFVACALHSGERKSPAFREVTKPLEDMERKSIVAARREVELRRAEHDILKKQLQTAKTRAASAVADDREAANEEVAQLVRDVAEFNLPPLPRFLADDATTEAIASLLAEQGGRMAVMSTEGGLFETLAGRYSDGVLNIDVYLKGYSGDPLRVDRKSRPSEFIPKPALTLCLTVQPEIIRGLAAKPGFRGRGLLGRFLYSIPKSLVGYRSNPAPPLPDSYRQAWHKTIEKILKLPFDEGGETHEISLAEGVGDLLHSYRDEVELQLRPGTDLSDIADWANKLPGAVVRMAGVLQLFQMSEEGEPWSIPISLETMESAIKLGRYFTEHALAAFSMMGADLRTEDSKVVWAAINRYNLERFTNRDLWLKVRRRFKVDYLLETLLNLCDYGYLRQVPARRADGPGRPPSPAFEVNPLAGTQNPLNTQISL